LIIEQIVFWTSFSYVCIDPVASKQKQTSINPKAGRGKLSFELFRKTVAVEGKINLFMHFSLTVVVPIDDDIAGLTSKDLLVFILAGIFLRGLFALDFIVELFGLLTIFLPS